MLEHRCQSASVDFLFTRQVGFEDQPVSEQRTWTELFDRGLAACPRPSDQAVESGAMMSGGFVPGLRRSYR